MTILQSITSRISAALLLLTALISPMSADAQDTYQDPYADYDEFIFFDYDLDQNIATPRVGDPEHKAIKEYINRMKDQLKSKYTLDLIRENEVLIVTIPTDDLFNPNDTLLTSYGINRLTPLLPYMQQDPMMFKIVYSVNTDNTGSPSYLEHLSEARSNSIYGWMIERLPEELVIIPYPSADDDPLVDNNSRDNRALNRRLEIYFIPGPKMIQMAHEGRLK